MPVDCNPYNLNKIEGEVRNLENNKADKTQLDEPWISTKMLEPYIKNITLPNLNTESFLTFDFSDLLPADNNYYELKILCQSKTAAVKNAETNLEIYGEQTYYASNCAFGMSTNAAVSVVATFGGRAVVGPNRKVMIKYYNVSSAGTINSIWVPAYRKKGKQQ